MMAGMDEESEHPELQDAELACVQQGAQAPWFADHLVRPWHGVGGEVDRQAWATARLQR